MNFPELAAQGITGWFRIFASVQEPGDTSYILVKNEGEVYTATKTAGENNIKNLCSLATKADCDGKIPKADTYNMALGYDKNVNGISIMVDGTYRGTTALKSETEAKVVGGDGDGWRALQSISDPHRTRLQIMDGKDYVEFLKSADSGQTWTSLGFIVPQKL